jgi:DNA-3-methyladenine glycosylase
MKAELSTGRGLSLGPKQRLPRSFFQERAVSTAGKLLGKILVYRKKDYILAGRIVETEAYPGKSDKASHSYQGRVTPRNRVLYASGGVLYLYIIYGIYTCCNIVCSVKGNPESVFIRAVEPLIGQDIMRKNSPRVKDEKFLTNGPCRWTRSFGFSKEMNQKSLTGKDLYLVPTGRQAFKIVPKKRIGIDYAGEAANKKLRFYIYGNRFVSKL